MIFSGHNCRKIGQTKRLSLETSISIDDLRGSGCIAISGMSLDGTEHKDLKFEFVQGKVIDPENRYVYSYFPNKTIRLSGDFYDNNYSYHIDGNPMCFVGIKDPMVVENFYINTYDCQITADTYVSSDEPNYGVIMGDSFSKQGSFLVSVSNGSSLPFTIFDASFTTSDLQSSTVGEGSDGVWQHVEVGVYTPANLVFSAVETAEVGTYTSQTLTLNTSLGDLIKTGISITLIT